MGQAVNRYVARYTANGEASIGAVDDLLGAGVKVIEEGCRLFLVEAPDLATVALALGAGWVVAPEVLCQVAS